MNYPARSDRDKKGGFTLVEVLLVVGLVSILGATASPFLSRFVLQVNFDAAVDKIISSIRKSQEYAMDGRSGATWGVCVAGSQIRLFSGSCASPTTSENFAFPGTVSISGLGPITFNKRGEPSATTAITVSTALETKTLRLNNAGGLEEN